MIFGSSAILLCIEIIFLALLPKRLLAELVEQLFDINCIDHRNLLMSYFGRKINFFTSRRFRFSLVIQIAFIVWVMVLLLLDACSMHIKYFSNNDNCPSQPSDCFITKKFSSSTRYVCESGEKISIQTNLPVVCFVWVYSEQTTLGVLNELGICSSVFSLLCYAFKFACRISRKPLGLILIVGLTLLLMVLLIFFIITNIFVSITTRLLLVVFTCLLINVIQLLQFTRSYDFIENN